MPETILEDWTGIEHAGEALFYYRYTCQLWRGDRLMGEAVGSCNSREIKYRFRWISREEAVKRSDFDSLQTRGGRQFEPEFAIDKSETSGKYGKPAEYWQRYKDAISNGTAEKKDKKMGTKTFAGYEIDTTLYRVPNPDVADQINTIQKMAQKRALVAAVLVVTNCSDAFTQDLLEDGEDRSEPMPEGVHKIDSGQPKAEPDDETMLAYLARIEAEPTQAETIAVVILDDIEMLMGKDMADRTWKAFTRNSGNPPTVEANKKAYWTIAVRALHGNLKELKARADKQNKT